MSDRWIGPLAIILVGLIGLPLLRYATAAGPESLRPLPANIASSNRRAAASDFNLVQNPSFEGDYYNPQTRASALVAPGWSIWFVDDPAVDHHIPEWNEEVLLGANKVSWRARHGDKSQKMFSSFSRHEGGMYQQVNVVPGSELEFSAWVEVWSNHEFDPCESPADNHGGYRVAVGIDPTGGTDPLANSVQWNEYQLLWDIPYDVWNRIAVAATAQASQVTVFTRGWAEFPVQFNDSYWEDAKLTYLTPPDLPNDVYLPLVMSNYAGRMPATPTITPTPTSTATATPTVILTPTGTATPTSTATPTTEPTASTTPAATSTPTVTPTTEPDCADYIDDGGFDEPLDQTAWGVQSGVPYAPERVTDIGHEDTTSLRLGAPPDSEDAESWSAAWQAVTLPAEPDSATLRLAYWPETTDTARDFFEARVLDQDFNPVAYLVHPIDGWLDARWHTVDFDMSSYAGRTIYLYFNVYNDGQNGNSRVYLDSVELEVCGGTAGQPGAQVSGLREPRLDRVQGVPFGQVRLTWARYGKRTPNINWTACTVHPSDVEIEWVWAVNSGPSPVNLGGWKLENSEGEVFVFPSFTIRPGETNRIRIWTDSRENAPRDVFMHRTEEMWDDTTGRAILRFPNGDLAATPMCWDLPTGGYTFPCADEG